MQPLTKSEMPLSIDGFHNIYYFEFDKDHSHPTESHEYWEMVYVDMGNILAITTKDSIPLAQEQVIFRQPGEPHAHVSNKEHSNNLLVVSFSCDSPCMAFFKEHKVFTLDKTAKTLLSLFVGEAKNALGHIPNRFSDHAPLDFSQEMFGASQLMEHHFSEFLIKLIRNHSENHQPIGGNERQSDDDQQAHRIAEYLKAHIYENIGLNDLCDAFFLRKSQLSLLFKNSHGTSPMKYFNELKIAEAKRLLREDNDSISEIAEKLGFSCIHSFSRNFKAITGFCPTAYKKSVSE